MTKLESLKQLLEYQVDKGFDIELKYYHTELNSAEVQDLISIINNTNQYYSPQTISIDGSSYDMLIVATKKTNDDDYDALDPQSEAVLDEEVAAYELKVEQEEDARDKKERIKKDKETERKRIMRNRKKEKELDDIFYEHWINKIKALKDLIPNTDNHFEGRGRDKK